MKKIRRVVTGLLNGKAGIASDVEVPEIVLALAGGVTTVPLCGAATPPAVPNSGELAQAPKFSPPPGGYHFSVFSVPPMNEVLAAEPPADSGKAREEMEREVPGLLELMDPDVPGMHATTSIDFIVVLSGAITLELDSGVATVLHAGDTVIQNGVRHRWLNNGTERAWVAAVVLGTERFTQANLRFE
ncbi:cupin [Cupriavidus sp. SK-4]|uniref:cupin domain-containing protein n=1 Tax=Cupriavidus sp. SK-4 TaxID=574750 RepID=UPI0004524C4C|nr:cupin domain-containing protein [Cupriavidus sp. SK-4]EYS91620.1 cupin [Cupriavidus sp. SK-4]